MAATIYFETVPGKKKEQALADILYVLEQHAVHPAWLRLDGRPVIFVYGRAVADIGTDGWLWVTTEVRRRFKGGAVFIGDGLNEEVALTFDGIHTYNVTSQTRNMSVADLRAWGQEHYTSLRAIAGSRILVATVIPGYDDTPLGRDMPRPTTPRHDGRTYETLWREAIDAHPDWVVITSWNEWHEGSEIEPSREHGKKALHTTRRYATAFKQMTPLHPSPPVASDLSRVLAGKQVGVLPGWNSGTVASLLRTGGEPVLLEWGDVTGVDPLAPHHMPVVLYAGGETYAGAASATRDVARALAEYVERGGTLCVFPSAPMPFQYDAEKNIVRHWESLGLPLAVAWESPPTGRLFVFHNVSPSTLTATENAFAFPSAGDRRWRPLWPRRAAEGIAVEPLLELKDGTGRSHGLGAGVVRRGEGRIIYSWFRLLDGPSGKRLLEDLWRLADR
jgi:hypothetical protein